ncbi:MAG: 4Fe-4S dicluster domain-containing protein [Thermoguttaceae bacterium]
MRRPLGIPWHWWRRAAQLALLLLFLWLFRRTEYMPPADPNAMAGADGLRGGENLFFRLDPLAAAAAMIGARQWITAFWPALVVALLTVLLGRFFCGWMCPLGTLLDCFHRLLRPLASRTNRLVESRHANRRELTAHEAATPMSRLRPARYVLLIAVLAAAVLAFPLAGYLDPFSLLMRGATCWADPSLHRGATETLAWMAERWDAEALRDWTDRWHVFPLRPAVFQLAWLSATLLAILFALEFVAKRFWCRYLCPAGALFGLLGRRPLLKRVPSRACSSCDVCSSACRMDAVHSSSGFSAADCTLCMDCVSRCPRGIVRFTWTGPKRRQMTQGDDGRKSDATARHVDLSRRSALAGLLVGVAAPGVVGAIRALRPTPIDPHLLRPPGAGDEKTFLNLCIRCGECLKVCPTGVLQPAAFEAGVEGVFSPRLLPRFVFEQTNCDYTCTLCGQVCPTGAIPRLSEDEKHRHPTGKAYFDHARCLPWAKQEPCIRCEEMCPTPEKAIKIGKTLTVKGEDGQPVDVQIPYVDRDLCVGCGICESNCPLDDAAGIRVRRVDAPDPGSEFLQSR